MIMMDVIKKYCLRIANDGSDASDSINNGLGVDVVQRSFVEIIKLVLWIVDFKAREL